MEALAAFSLACNLLQVLDFGFNILKGSFYLAQPGEDSLPENRTSSALASDLRVLAAEIQSTSSSSGSDERLKILCAGCDELAQELIRVLNSLKVVKRRQLVAKAIQAQFEKKKMSALERRLDGYRSEIHLYITAHLRARVDVNAATQLDAFKSLSDDSQTSFLALLKAINDGTKQVMDRIDHQTSIMETLHQHSNQSILTEAEQTRQQLAVESAQSRLEIISNLQDKIDRSTNDVASQLDHSASQINAANAATQDVLVQTIKMSEQTVQDDISRLRQNLLLVSKQILSTEAKLNQIIRQLDQSKKNNGHRNALQVEGTRLTKFLLSLQTLYAEFQKILNNLIKHAVSLIGSIKPKELSNEESHRDTDAVLLSGIQRKLDPNTYSIVAPPADDCSLIEAVHMEVLIRYYHYYYLPLLPPRHRLLSSISLKKYRQPLCVRANEFARRRESVDVRALTNLALDVDEFVWFMALLVAALDSCVGEQRCNSIIRMVFDVMDHWLGNDQKPSARWEAELDDGALSGLAELVSAVAVATTKLSQGQATRFSLDTMLGAKLVEDLALWRKTAAMSDLAREAEAMARDEIASSHLGAVISPSLGENAQDLQAASLLVCAIITMRSGKTLLIGSNPEAPSTTRLVGYPGKRVYSNDLLLSISRQSMALLLTRVLGRLCFYWAQYVMRLSEDSESNCVYYWDAGPRDRKKRRGSLPTRSSMMEIDLEKGQMVSGSSTSEI